MREIVDVPEGFQEELSCNSPLHTIARALIRLAYEFKRFNDREEL
jgi:hypothetical protein